MNEYLSPDEITGASFETRRRGGLDPDSVRSHLRAAADTVAALLDERDGLVAELEKVQSALDSASEAAPEAAPVELDEEALTEQLGQHAARVLAEARSAAADRIAEAEAEADDIRAAAEELHAQRSVAADAQAQQIREEADELLSNRELEANETAATILAEAERKASELQTASSVSREEADHDAERIIRDAEVTRRQILEDLARRRTAARRQIEQLRAGRERLLASHETVRRTLDEIGEELTISMSEARAAAETAGHTVSETTIEELEAEIETARLTGLLDTGPVPVVGSTPPNRAATSKAIPTSTKPVEAKSPRLSSVAPPTDDPVDATSDEVEDDHSGDPDEEGATVDALSETIEDTEDTDESADVVADSQERGQDADESERAGSSDGLASVVSLDQARSEVETRSHPAAGREVTGSRSSDLGEDADVEEAVEQGAVEVVEAELVVAAVPDEDTAVEDTAVEDTAAEDTAKDDAVVAVVPDQDTAVEDTAEEDAGVDAIAESDPAEQSEPVDSVDSLFASLRNSTASQTLDESDHTDDSDDSDVGSDAEQSAADEEAAEEVDEDVPVTDPVDRASAARRMKRVLADEQSRAMSTLKGGEELPSADDLLGSVDDHVLSYWSVSSEYLGEGASAPTAMVEFVQQIRHKVSVALDQADDTDTVVDALRSMYREFKTSGIDICLDEIMSDDVGATAKPAS